MVSLGFVSEDDVSSGVTLECESLEDGFAVVSIGHSGCYHTGLGLFFNEVPRPLWINVKLKAKSWL